MEIEHLIQEATELLKQLIATPSLSRQEDQTAQLLEAFFSKHHIAYLRSQHNVWAKNKHFDASKPTLLLNSHHDTVKPNSGYTKDPHNPVVEGGKLFGLGSNDAGGCLVSLIATFIHFYEAENLSHNLVLACTAEEEISGKNGIASLLPELPNIDVAIVGEPTLMDMAIAEKGLMVLDCTAHGKSGHAARDEGENAIFKAIQDINWFNSYQFEKESDFLGPIKMTTTIIQAGSQHNVVPNACTFTVDVRTTDAFSNVDTLEIIRQHVQAEVTPRSTRLNPSSIPPDHGLVTAGLAMGWSTYGSPTLSDQSLLPCASIKVGPGDSARSHTADEFIYLEEIEKGIQGYIEWLGKFLTS